MIYYESMIIIFLMILTVYTIKIYDWGMWSWYVWIYDYFFLKIFIIIFWLFIESESMINFVNYLGSQKHNDTSLIKNLIVINTSVVESEGK